MPVGTVHWFNDSKGVGSIRTDGGRDVFVRFSAIREDGFRTLTEGETVRFDIRETDRGPEAANVVKN